MSSTRPDWLSLAMLSMQMKLVPGKCTRLVSKNRRLIIAKRMGFVFSGNTFGLLISPFLAGLVYDHAGYYAVFGIIFGVFGLDLLLRAFMIEKRKAMKYLPEESKSSTATSPNVQDIRGARNTTSDQISGHEDDSSGSSENANRQEPQGSPYDPDERTHLLPHLSNPKKTTSWFSRHFPKFSILARSPRLIAAFYGCLTHEMLLGCLDSILPLFVKRTFHWTATGAGSIFLAITCPSLLTTIFGALADKFGARPVSLLGLILVTLNLGLMGIVNDDSMVSKVLLCVFLVLVGRYSPLYFNHDPQHPLISKNLISLFLLLRPLP